MDRLVLAMERRKNSCLGGLRCRRSDFDNATPSVFRSHRLSIGFHVPNRLRDGYGLNCRQLEELAKEGVGVVITVDCGISNAKEVAFANEMGVDVVIIDHHEIPDVLPEACAIVDPHQTDCSYPFTGMAAAGLTFHLLIGLRSRLRELDWFGQEVPEPDIRKYLGLAAIGTVADVAPLKDVNRLLTRSGLEVLKKTDDPGIRALIDVCQSGHSRR